MKNNLISKITVTVLTAAAVLASAPLTAFADEVPTSELTWADNEDTTSSAVPVTESGMLTAAEGTDTGGTTSVVVVAGADSGTSDLVAVTGADSQTSSVVAVAGSSGSSNVVTSGSTTGSSNVIVAGSTSSSSGPSSGSSGDSSRGNVMVAGSGGSGIITTEGEKTNTIYSDILGGATLIMFHSETGRQILSCMIVTNNGSIIMVDGGFGEDAEYLTQQIVARGGHVSAWLITHPHGDHAGALYTILQNEDARYALGLPAQVTVDAIYCALGDEQWYIQNDPDEATMASALIGEFAGLSDSVLHTPYYGETFQIDTATVQVLNNRFDQASTKKGNNASTVYKVTVNGVSILFLGDLSEEGANYLLATIDPSMLKSDIVQLTHHGQADVSEDFYKWVSPTICLWATPDYMWADQGSTYTVNTVKQWMADLGVQRHYCMKDGDQIIR